MDPDAAMLAHELLRTWNERDLDGFLALMDDGIVWYDPGMTDSPAHGKKAVRAFSQAVLNAFPDFTYSLREPICVSADGQRCVFPWRIRATHSGWMNPPGLAPTGQNADFDGVDLVDSSKGKIVRIETYFDTVSAAEQLLRVKLRPRPGSMMEQAMVLLQRARALWLRRFRTPPKTV